MTDIAPRYTLDVDLIRSCFFDTILLGSLIKVTTTTLSARMPRMWVRRVLSNDTYFEVKKLDFYRI